MEKAESDGMPAGYGGLYRTRIGLEQTGNDPQQRALSGSILANQPQAFSA